MARLYCPFCNVSFLSITFLHTYAIHQPYSGRAHPLRAPLSYAASLPRCFHYFQESLNTQSIIRRSYVDPCKRSSSVIPGPLLADFLVRAPLSPSCTTTVRCGSHGRLRAYEPRRPQPSFQAHILELIILEGTGPPAGMAPPRSIAGSHHRRGRPDLHSAAPSRPGLPDELHKGGFSCARHRRCVLPFRIALEHNADFHISHFGCTLCRAGHRLGSDGRRGRRGRRGAGDG